MKRTTELSELRGGSVQEVEERLGTLRKEIMNLRFRKAVGRLEKPARLRLLRRQVARAMTVLREKGVNS